MRLTTFTAPDMRVAMEHIRESIGEDAVIISSNHTDDGRAVNVTVAIEDDLPTEAEEIETGAGDEYEREYRRNHHGNEAATGSSANSNALIAEFESVFDFHSTPRKTLEYLLGLAVNVRFPQDITHSGISGSVTTLLEAAFDFAPLAMAKSGFSMMLIGTPGVGKTMAIAKIAAQLTVDKLPLCVISTDNSRAGGVEQLSAFTGILGLELKVADSPASLRRCLQECDASQRILVDSAGCNPYDGEQLTELRELLHVANNVEPVLVIPAGTDGAEACHIAETFAGLGAKRLLVSRVDTARRYGSLLAAAAHSGLSFCNLSDSARVVDGVAPLDAPQMGYMLTRYLL